MPKKYVTGGASGYTKDTVTELTGDLAMLSKKTQDAVNGQGHDVRVNWKATASLTAENRGQPTKEKNRALTPIEEAEKMYRQDMQPLLDSYYKKRNFDELKINEKDIIKSFDWSLVFSVVGKNEKLFRKIWGGVLMLRKEMEKKELQKKWQYLVSMIQAFGPREETHIIISRLFASVKNLFKDDESTKRVIAELVSTAKRLNGDVFGLSHGLFSLRVIIEDEESLRKLDGDLVLILEKSQETFEGGEVFLYDVFGHFKSYISPKILKSNWPRILESILENPKQAFEKFFNKVYSDEDLLEILDEFDRGSAMTAAIPQEFIAEFEKMAQQAGGKAAWSEVLDAIAPEIGFGRPHHVDIMIHEAWDKFIDSSENRDIVRRANDIVKDHINRNGPDAPLHKDQEREMSDIIYTQLVFPEKLEESVKAKAKNWAQELEDTHGRVTAEEI